MNGDEHLSPWQIPPSGPIPGVAAGVVAAFPCPCCRTWARPAFGPYGVAVTRCCRVIIGGPVAAAAFDTVARILRDPGRRN